MNRLFNPFAEVFETNRFPHARTLRTSLNQKLWDTFNTISGKAPIATKKTHLGLFDYLTLGVPALLLYGLLWSIQNADKKILAKILIVPLIMVNVFLIISRFTVGAAATILFSPITALVHGISMLLAQNLHEKALSLLGKQYNGQELRLDEYLKESNMDIEDLDITARKLDKLKESEQRAEANTEIGYKLMFRRKTTGPKGAVVCEGCLNGEHNVGHAPFSIDIKPDAVTETQSLQLHSLFRLNVGNVVANIEDSESLNSDEGDILLRI